MRILTWNIQWGRGVDGRVDLERIAAVVRGHAADVVCLQEVARHHPDLPGGADDDQAAQLARLFPDCEAIYGIGSDLSDGRGGRRQFGNLILSRQPLLQAFRHSLPWPADAAVPSMPRVAVEVVVDAPGGPLRVTTTHLEYYSALQRRAQIEGLRRLHGEACGHADRLRPDDGVDAPFAARPRPLSALICGDFNLPPEAPEYAMLLEPIEGAPSLRDAWNLARPGAAHAPTVGVNGAEWPDHPYCCDFFFVSEDLAPRVAGVTVDAATAASDHQPVVLTLRDRRGNGRGPAASFLVTAATLD